MRLAQICSRAAFAAKPRVLAVLFVVCALVSLLSAQMGPNLDEGLKPFGSFQGGNIDTVSMTSGNVTVHIPIASYPQRGGKLDQQFYLRMNSKGWTAITHDDAHGLPDGKGWVTPGGRDAGPNAAIVASHDLVLHRSRINQWSCDELVSSDAFDYRVETDLMGWTRPDN
jgi:hypothetical protein